METLGSLIDKLTIVNLKMFKLEDLKRNPEATDKAIADATRDTNKLNQNRNELITEIDAMMGVTNYNSIKSYGK